MTTKAQLTGEHGTFLACPYDHGQWSATPGDYFMLPDDHEFTCNECGEIIYECREVRQILPVSR